jgi:alkanesulfonate monooxygenase SsuD/methylene tetrahydromethanopterin reductase-like flavin-dependent oxidoreductase (luciferase family)
VSRDRRTLAARPNDEGVGLELEPAGMTEARAADSSRPLLLGIHVLTYGATWPDALATVRLADGLGYDFVFAADHLYATGGDPHEPFFEGWTSLAAWAQATTRPRLGLLVGANTFRNPGVVAKMVTTLDHISGGRAILGLGAAWEELEQRAHGIDPGRSLGQRLDWLDESLGLIRRVLAGDEVTHHGDHYRFERVRHAPQPLQPSIPVLVGATGEKKGLRIVARHADLWQVWAEPQSTAAFEHLDEVLRAHCADVGRDASEIVRLIGAKVIIRDSRAQAIADFERVAAARGWRGEVLDYIRPHVWADTARGIATALDRYRALGVGGFVVQVFDPFDRETIERLAGEVLQRPGRGNAPAVTSHARLAIPRTSTASS